MASTPAVRDRSRLAVAAVSGLTVITALSATGWLAGTAARSADAQQATQAQPDAKSRAGVGRAARHRPVVLRPRPQRTHTTVRYVQGTPSAPVGSGGTVSQPVAHAPSAAAPHPAPPPPPSAPAAPSSGS